jgi:hypothetical protein
MTLAASPDGVAALLGGSRNAGTGARTGSRATRPLGLAMVDDLIAHRRRRPLAFPLRREAYRPKDLDIAEYTILSTIQPMEMISPGVRRSSRALHLWAAALLPLRH